jgi:hypothetical protein
MDHLRVVLAGLVSALGGPAAACGRWGVGRSTLFGWLKGKHPPSLLALHRILVTLPVTDRYRVYMAIEADAEAAARSTP